MKRALLVLCAALGLMAAAQPALAQQYGNWQQRGSPGWYGKSPYGDAYGYRRWYPYQADPGYGYSYPGYGPGYGAAINTPMSYNDWVAAGRPAGVYVLPQNADPRGPGLGVYQLEQ